MKNLKILKFGGTSVGNKQSIQQILKIIKNDQNQNKVVVVSAPNGITDLLLQSLNQPHLYYQVEKRIISLMKILKIKSKEINNLLLKLRASLKKRLPEKEKKDLIASFGERFSIYLVSEFFNDKGLDSLPVDAREFVLTDSDFTNACVDYKKTCPRARKYLRPILKSAKIPVVTGFIAKNSKGKTTTLGRGGSDLTATLLGRCLKANLVELWTDSDGIMTADPRIVSQAQIIDKISFEEVMELSNFGAKVVYHRALEPVYFSQTPVKVLNTFNPSCQGTLISGSNNNRIFSVTGKKDISLLTVFSPEMIGVVGYLARLFKIFKDLQISVDVIAVSEASVSLSFHQLPSKNISLLKEKVSQLGKVEIKSHKAIVSIISNYLKSHQGLIAKAINRLTQQQIDIEAISYGNTEINLMFIIDEKDLTKGVKSLHQYLLRKI